MKCQTFLTISATGYLMFITSNEQQHGDLGEVEKYHRGAALEVAFVCQLCELATPRAEAIKGP